MGDYIIVIRNILKDRPSDYLKASASDKTGRVHDYSDLYDLLFVSLLSIVEAPIRVLEIGVSRFGEGSGHAFSKMPYVEKFVGLDIMPLKSDFGEKGVFLHIDAYTAEGVAAAKAHGPFHLIIDDAEHAHAQQVAFFSLYPILCAKPSVMVCEDVQKDKLDTRLQAIADPRLMVVQVPAVPQSRPNDPGILIDNLALVKLNL